MDSHTQCVILGVSKVTPQFEVFYMSPDQHKSDLQSSIPFSCRLYDAGRNLDCVGATTFADSLTTMVVDVNGGYVFVSYVAAPAQHTRTGIRCVENIIGKTLRRTLRPSAEYDVGRFRTKQRGKSTYVVRREIYEAFSLRNFSP